MPAAVMIATFLKTAIVFIVCLAVGDIVGAVACTIFDISSIRGWSAALPYAIWLVDGVFVGLFTVFLAGTWIAGKDDKWDEGPRAAGIANGIFLSSLAVSIALCVLFWRLYWSQGVEGDYYVPDSQSHSITYLVAALGGMWLVRLVSKPQPKA
jgi:hypothetical protein